MIDNRNYGFVSRIPEGGFFESFADGTLPMFGGVLADIGQKRREEKALGEMWSWCLSDVDEGSRGKAQEAFGENMLKRNGSSSQMKLVGGKIATAMGCFGAPDQYWRRRGEEPPKVKRKSELLEYIGRDFDQKAHEWHAKEQARVQAFKKGRQDFYDSINRDLPAMVFEGRAVTPEQQAHLNKYDDEGKVLGSVSRARAAGKYLLDRLMPGGNVEGYKAAVEKRKAELRRELDVTNAANAGWGMAVTMTDEELDAQAASDVSKSYKFSFSRKDIAAITRLLEDDNGQLDEVALSAVMTALRKKAEGERGVDSKFWRNAGIAVARWAADFMDEQERTASKTGVRLRGVSAEGVTVVPVTEYEREHLQEQFSPNVEKVRSMLEQLEDTRLEPSKNASEFAAALSNVGTIAGGTAPYIAASVATGGGAAGVLLGTALSQAAQVNRSIGNAYREGKAMPELFGLISGTASAGAEGLFGTAFMRIPGVNKLFDAAAVKTMSVPGLGRALGAIEGSLWGRLVAGTALETAGELVVEDMVADGATWATVNGLRKLGVAFDEETFTGIRQRIEALGADGRQTAAAVAFCVVMGLSGAPAQYEAAKAFAGNRDALVAAGVPKDVANETAEAVQRGVLSGQQMVDKCKAAWIDSIMHDPAGAMKRLEEDRQVYLSKVQAEVDKRDGVLQAALKEQGVLKSVRADEEGMYSVTVEDYAKKEQDAETWERGEDGTAIEPEDYVMPTKEVKMGGEQLAAYARYLATEKDVARMRRIRSAASLGDALGKVDADLVQAIPLSSIDAPVVAALAKSEGSMTAPVLKALSDAAYEHAAEGVSLIDGIANADLMRAPAALAQRTDIAEQRGEMTAQEAKARRQGTVRKGAAAVRFTAEPGAGGARNRVLINEGHTTTKAYAEDVVESVLDDAIERRGGEQSAEGRAYMQAVARQLEQTRQAVQEATGEDIAPGFNPETAGKMELLEYFSAFAQSAFYRDADANALTDAQQFTVKFTDAALMSATMMKAARDGYGKWVSSTAEGKAFEEKGGELGDLMRAANIQLGKLYDQTRVTAENLYKVMEARAEARGEAWADEAEVKELSAAAEQQQKEAEEREMPPIEVEESVSEEVSAEELAESIEQERAPLDDEGHVKTPPGAEVETDAEGAGKGLLDGEFARMYDGSLLASARVGDIHPCKDIPQKRGKAAKVKGKRRRDAEPVTVWRRKDGRLELIAGRRRYAASKAAGDNLIAVRVFDEDATHDARWARLYNAEDNIRDGTATPEQVAFCYREQGLTDSLAEERGLLPRDVNGRPLKAVTIGATIARKASAEVYEKFMAGAMSPAEAYAASARGEGSGGISMSLDLDNGVGAMQVVTRTNPQEEALDKLRRSCEKASRQWMARFKGSNSERERARGSTIGMAMGVYRAIPEKYRPKLDALLRRGAVLERMIATGKLRSYGQISSAELAELRGMALDRMHERWRELLEERGYNSDKASLNERPDGMSAETEKALWDELKRETIEQLGKEGLEGVYRAIAEEAAACARAYLHDVEMERLGALLDRFTPKVDKASRRLKKGIANADFYCEVDTLREKMAASEGERAKAVEVLTDRLNVLSRKNDALTPDEQKELKEAEAALSDWMVFGALGSRGYEAVRTARELLGARAAEAMGYWAKTISVQKNKLQAIVNKGLKGMGEASEGQLATMKQAFDGSAMAKLKDLGNNAMSMGHLMATLATVPGLEQYGQECVQAIASGHIAMGERMGAQQRAMDDFMMRELGLVSERERNEFMVEMNKRYQTKIKPLHELDSWEDTVSVADAERWLGMTAEQRERARDEWNEKRRGAQPPPEYAMEALREAYEENRTGDYARLKREARAELRAEQGMPGKVTEKPHVPKEKFTVRAEARKEGRKTPLFISKNQALNVLLLCEQPRYQKNAIKHGFTEEIQRELYEFVGEKVLKFGYWMRDYMNNGELDAVFEEREGVPFPKEENYWTGKFDLSAKIDMTDALEKSHLGAGTRYSITKLRVDHNLTFDLTIGATHTFLGTMAQQNTYICLGRITSEWRSLLANAKFARALRLTIGESRFKLLLQGLNLLDMQGLNEASAQRSMGWLVGAAQSMLAVSYLAGSAFTYLKQGAAYMHGACAPGAHFWNMAGSLIGIRREKGAMTLSRMAQEPAFRARMEHNEAKYKVYSKLMAARADANYSRLAEFAQKGMDVMDRIDVSANLLSMTNLYNLTWSRLAKESKASGETLTDEQMHEACMKVVEVTLDQAAMPALKSQESIGRYYGGAAGMISFFMSGEALNKMGVYARRYHEKGGGWRGFVHAWKFMAAMSVTEQALLMMIELWKGGGDDEDFDWTFFAGHFLTGVSGLGVLNNAPIVGDVVSELVHGLGSLAGMNTKLLRTDSLAKAMGYDIRGIFRDTKRAFDGKSKDGEDWFRIVQNLLRAGSGFMGLKGGVSSPSKFFAEASGLIQTLNAGANAARPFVDAYAGWVK